MTRADVLAEQNAAAEADGLAVRFDVDDRPHYYRPTPGVDVGTWNVFPRDGSPSTLNVAYKDLPAEVRGYIARSGSREAIVFWFDGAA